MLERERRRDPIATLSHANHRDPVGIDVGAGQHRVEHRGEDPLPVGTKRDPALQQHRLLPRAVEGQPVITALGRGGARVRPHLRGRLVGAIVDHHERAAPACSVGSREEEGRQGGALVGDGNPLARHRAQIEDLLPACPLAAPDSEPAVWFAGMRDQVQRGGVIGDR